MTVPTVWCWQAQILPQWRQRNAETVQHSQSSSSTGYENSMEERLTQLTICIYVPASHVTRWTQREYMPTKGTFSAWFMSDIKWICLINSSVTYPFYFEALRCSDHEAGISFECKFSIEVFSTAAIRQAALISVKLSAALWEKSVGGPGNNYSISTMAWFLPVSRAPFPSHRPAPEKTLLRISQNWPPLWQLIIIKTLICFHVMF